MRCFRKGKKRKTKFIEIQALGRCELGKERKREIRGGEGGKEGKGKRGEKKEEMRHK